LELILQAEQLVRDQRRIARRVTAIWNKDTENGLMRHVTISRLYKDGAAWKDTTSFGRDDLLLVGKLCDLEHSWIYDQKHKTP
jgi:hypothetical protein